MDASPVVAEIPWNKNPQCLSQIIVISSPLIVFRNSGTIGSNINDKSVLLVYIYINGTFDSLTSFE